MWEEWLTPGVIPFTIPQKVTRNLNIDKKKTAARGSDRVTLRFAPGFLGSLRSAHQ